jgi:hypothetical protein
MTTASKDLAFTVAEVDGGVSQRLANYVMLVCYHWNAPVYPLALTLVASHFSLDQVTDLATWRQVGDVQIGRHAGSKETSGSHSKRTAKVDHAGYCASVKDVQSILDAFQY